MLQLDNVNVGDYRIGATKHEQEEHPPAAMKKGGLWTDCLPLDPFQDSLCFVGALISSLSGVSLPPAGSLSFHAQHDGFLHFSSPAIRLKGSLPKQ